MTDETVAPPEDPRRPQGAWPGVVFVIGLFAVGLVTCSQPFHPLTGVTPLPADGAPAAATPSAPPPAAPIAAPPSPQAAKPSLKPAASDLSAGAKTILADLGQSPSAKACETAFTKLARSEPFGFRRNLASLGDKAKASLKGAAAIASVCSAHKIEVGGYTDRSGSKAFNQKVSEARAAAVKEYLIAQGAPAAALTSKGYGESRPLKGARAAKSRRIGFAVAN